MPNDPPFLEELGLWVQANRPGAEFGGKPALFLDRDGVIIADTGYPGRPEDVVMLDVAVPAIRHANRLGAAVIVVTNQSGVGRGYSTWDDFAAVTARIDSELSQRGAHIDFLLACAYHGDARPPYDVENHPMRKPNPGMILRGAELSGTEPKDSVIVGDAASDMEAGRRAGLKSGWLVGGEPGKDASFPIRRFGRHISDPFT